MAEPSFTLQADQIADTLRDFIRLKPRLKVVLPEDIAQLKERLGELHPDGGAGRAADYDLFYRIGIVLSRQKEPLSMGELSQALAVPLSTATRMVDWLVESGYAERLPYPADRRIVRVSLTGTGQELYQTIGEFVKQRIEHILRRLDAKERKDLIPLLRKVMEALEQIGE